MLRSISYSLVVAILCGMLAWPGVGDAANERVALLLNGDACGQRVPMIGAVLAERRGVSHVDLESVPQHVLIDADTALTSPEQLEAQLNEFLAHEPLCRAEIMRSCISAGPPLATHRVP